MQEMVYLKAIQKSVPMGVSVSGTTDQKTYLKKFKGGFSPLAPPLDPPMYTVTFVEQPSCHSLDICENKWYHLIDAQINIQNMILPHVK